MKKPARPMKTSKPKPMKQQAVTKPVVPKKKGG